MDLTSLLNVTAAGAATGGATAGHERGHSDASACMEATHLPSATAAGSTAPSSAVATPVLETSPRIMGKPGTSSRGRSRTPWDAGGYSLSRALDAKKMLRGSPGAPVLSVASTSPCGDVPLFSDMMELETSSPKGDSPRHKFSDSRSSLSSSHTVSSSTNSASHSRISSLSTVSETQPLTSLITDLSQFEARVSDSSASFCGVSHIQTLPTSQQSPGRSKDFHPDSPTPVRTRHNMPYEGSPERSPTSQYRPQSPSDAILIPRFANGVDASLIPRDARFKSSSPYSRTHSRNYPQRNQSATQCHKRAASAPDFPLIGTSTFDPHFPTFGPIPEPTPSPSQHSESISMDREIAFAMRSAAEADIRLEADPQLTQQSLNSDQPPTDTSPGYGELGAVQNQPHAGEAVEQFVDFETASVCMYRGDCQTGSQLRKAISHIFGRNKLCTRMIPTGVWVHYCRKHYQRTRYRNGGEYPQRQIGLVQEQVKRVQAWSDSNMRRGRGPVLKNWSLSVRKREQMRLEIKMAAAGKKRPFQEEGEEEDEEGADEDRSDTSGTAVPDWVISQIGDGYSTTEILQVVERLKADIDQCRLQQIPDIEILPNIATEMRNDHGPTSIRKAFPKRRATGSRSSNGSFGSAAGASHRRSQSVNAAGLYQDSADMPQRCSQSSNFFLPPRTMQHNESQPPSEKRQRVDDRLERLGGTYRPPGSFEGPAVSMPGSALDPSCAGGGVQIPHRPAFGEPQEERAESYDYHHHAEDRGFGLANGANADRYERRYNNGLGLPGSYGHRSCLGCEHQQISPGPVGPVTGYSKASGVMRHDGSTAAPNMETALYAATSANSAIARRAGMHQRSHSEATFHHHQPSPHQSRPTSSSGSLGYMGGGRFGPIPTEKMPSPFRACSPDQGGYGTYRSPNYEQTARMEEDRMGSAGGVGGQQPYSYGNGNGPEASERFENFQLPPLQSLSRLHSHQRHMSSIGRSSFGMDPKIGSVAEHPESGRHMRHQSSPAVPRMMLPTHMDAGISSHVPNMGRPVSPGV